MLHTIRPAAARLTQTAERRPRLALVLLCLALWLPGFFTIPASDRDEARFAQATRQMLETGDHVRIRYQEEERNKKPVGIHWLQVTSVRTAQALYLAGPGDIWAYRVPSLLGALLAVLAAFHWGRGLVGRRPALLGAALLASTLVLTVEAHIAKTDAALLASVVAAMGLFGQCYLRPAAFTAGNAAAFWLILGVSILLKGPIGPMVALLTGITLAVADRGAVWWRALRPAWGVALMLAVAVPWLVAIGLATEGRFFAQAVGGDMLGKVGAGEEKHWGPPGFYVLSFVIAGFPGAWLALAALPGAWRDRLIPATRFLLAWIVPSWLLFEAVQTKLPHYVLPMFPALMLLAAAWALDPLRRMPPRWLRWLGLLAMAAVALGLGVLALVLPLKLEGPALLWGGPLALLAALALLGVVLGQAWRGRWGAAGWAGVVLTVPLYLGVFEGLLPELQAVWVSQRLAVALEAAAPDLPPARFGITGYAEPSLVFAVGTETHLLRNGEDAAAFLAAVPGRVVAVGDRADIAFRREAARLGLAPHPLGVVSGVNYTRGRFLSLQLFRLETPRGN